MFQWHIGERVNVIQFLQYAKKDVVFVRWYWISVTSFTHLTPSSVRGGSDGTNPKRWGFILNSQDEIRLIFVRPIFKFTTNSFDERGRVKSVWYYS